MTNSRIVAAMMARIVLFVFFIGSTLTLIFWITGYRDASALSCLVSVGVGGLALMVGGFFVARVRGGQ